ncbi:MAG TPA: nucleoside triphosphate pyrophosphohydrolase [Bacilli bacterium]|nr:nucleoside triphosphate pyrophosphohydrolase [Bacilli bacterium]
MGKITIIGLGAGELAQMPLGIYRKIIAQKHLFVRTLDHPVIVELEREGIAFHSFDAVYEKHEQFAHVYEEIVATLLEEAKQGDVMYAVPGHPLVAEKTVQLLLESGANVEVAGGQSFLDPMFASLGIDPIDGCQIVDGTALNKGELQIRHHIIICQVYDQFIASEVKLELMGLLPDDYPVTIATAVGTSSEKLVTVPLFELDRLAELNNLTAVYVPPVKEEALLYRDFTKLRDVIAELRGPNGCPWDKEQTHESLKKYLLEEAYEVLEAIDEQDDDHLIEELGDVLLQVMLHAQIGEDEGWFTIDDIIEELTEKMIRRHPHVFGSIHVESSDDVIANWDEIKKAEKEAQDSLLDSIPRSLPALMRAYDLQKKAAKVGFDWDDPTPMWEKLKEEIAEFSAETSKQNEAEMLKEFGDILFALVNIGRYYKLHPEEALTMTNDKFSRRFRFIEAEAKRHGQAMEEMSLEELDAIWEQAKKTE